MNSDQLVSAKRWMGQLPRDQFDLLLALVRDAVARERERCAKVAEQREDDEDNWLVWPDGEEIAAAIRAEVRP